MHTRWKNGAALVAAGLGMVALVAGVEAQQPSATYDPALYSALEWRNIGPFRGGRAVAVAGVPSQSLTFYTGYTGGGVWKTEDAGTTWKNVSDGFFRTGSVGAIAVADSDPNVVYVGTGEHCVRGVATSSGDGVYKSTDAGRTWRHVGLEPTKHISRIAIHPADSDLVYIAAQGSPYGSHDERGIYRSRDGGATWDLLLHVDPGTGASDLSMDATNPRILYAAFWDHERLPWKVRSGGPGSGLHKSSDGGDTWTKLSDELPAVMGRTAVSVSPANADRIWANIEADEGGLFRSDDAGATWKRVSDDRILRARAWYYTHVIADPVDADTVYVMNAPFLKSTDGGKTFQTIAVPHGDNHALWINPRNNRYMINANDGGANISFNGGATWSTQGNQPTAQFYRVNVDDQFPYWVYGAQQDNSTVAIASRTFADGIDRQDWIAGVGGCESAHIAFDRKAPRFIYAGCYQGQITEFDMQTRQRRNIMAYPALGLAEPSDEQKYRFNWNAPIVVSQHDPKVIYHAGNILFRSSDRGQSWTAVSPDLTRNDKNTQGPGGGPITNEGAGGEVYNTIFYVAESPHEAATIWVGTDDGLVQLTRDGGKTWTNVTPEEVGEWLINAIEVSPHDRATAYLAVTGYKRDDFTPHIYKTADYGKTWTRLVNGIGEEEFVRVVREDPVRTGLLYAGTERGVYVSFDGGARWQSLQINLPAVPVTDLNVRHNDLIASTQGRAFWILDDLTPLRQIADAARTDVHLFSPRPVHRVPGGTVDRPGIGKNASSGASIFYYLAKPPEPGTQASLEIVDSWGRVVRTFLSKPNEGEASDQEADRPAELPVKAGLNRLVWDFRTENLRRVPGIFATSSLLGYRVPPGAYEARLRIGGKVLTQKVQVLPDPRVQASSAEYARQVEVSGTIYGRVNEIRDAVISARKLREQVERVGEASAGHPKGQVVGSAATSLAGKIGDWVQSVIQTRHRTFQDVINFRNKLDEHYVFLGTAVDQTDPPVTTGMQQRFQDLEAAWSERRRDWTRLVDVDIASFNELCRQNGLPAVVVAPAAASDTSRAGGAQVR